MRLIEHLKEAVDNHQKEQDELYPDRHKIIHKVPCKNCPSAHYPPDPESQDIKDNISKEHFIKEYAFVCAWRQSKLCKGICDFMEVDQELIDKVHEKDDL